MPSDMLKSSFTWLDERAEIMNANKKKKKEKKII